MRLVELYLTTSNEHLEEYTDEEIVDLINSILAEAIPDTEVESPEYNPIFQGSRKGLFYDDFS